jgi:hypothetical protein
MGGCCTSVQYQPDHVPYLMPLRLVHIVPIGWFRVSEDLPIEPLPRRDINLATQWTTPLPIMARSGSQTELQAEISGWDVPNSYLGQYKLFAVDRNMAFSVFQPASHARFYNQAGAQTFDFSYTNTAIKLGQWNLLPEIFCFQDDTRPTIHVTSANTVENTYFARVGAIGWKYPLEELGPDEVRALGNTDRVPALRIWTGQQI